MNKQMIPALLATLVTVGILVILFSCAGNAQPPIDLPQKEQEETPAEELFRVMVSTDEHITVEGDNPRSVKKDENAAFTLIFDDGYAFSAASSGKYEGGVLTVEGVRRDIVITVTSIERRQAVSYEYDANGGTVAQTSGNQKDSEETDVETDGQKVTVTLKDEYLSEAGVLSTFWNDGTFTKPGSVLKEYNTKPDGTGERVTIGAKYCADAVDGADPKLYCIWEETDESDYSCLPYSFPRPSGVTAANSPEWQESGVIITGYTGNDETVAVPETIGGKPVIAIAAGAFTDCTSMKTLILPRFLLKAEAGAIVGCSSLETIYFPDGVYDFGNDVLDAASYENLKNLRVSASIAPRYAQSEGGAFALKLAKLLRTEGEDRVIVIGGSSAYQGLGTQYLEAMLGGDYAVVNLGTTRTTHGTIYLEAMQNLAHEGDVILFAPENSAYMLGESELYWKTLMNLENCYNYFDAIDISHYTNVFGAFTDFNVNYRYKRKPTRYEQIVKVETVTRDGDYQKSDRQSYCTGKNFVDSYFITMNNRVKSKNEGAWDDVAGQTANRDYQDTENPTWASLDDVKYSSLVNAAFDAARSSGAKVYFSFCPVDESKLVAGANSLSWLAAYDELILSTYHVDGILGKSKDYVFVHEYFYDCAFHPNDYGRTWRTYQVYKDLCALFGREVQAPDAMGKNFVGCLFERSCHSGKPAYNTRLLP